MIGRLIWQANICNSQTCNYNAYSTQQFQTDVHYIKGQIIELPFETLRIVLLLNDLKQVKRPAVELKTLWMINE
jgi:hypothetical protein